MANSSLLRRSGAKATMVRLGLTGFQRARRLVWFFTRPVTFGVRALPLTPDGDVVMVRHSYTTGWHLPGGGRKRGEDPVAAMLRELREEIGMTDHGDVEHAGDFRHRPNYKRDTVSFFIVRDVRFAPRLSLEIEAIAAFAPDALPDDAHPAARRRVEDWQQGVSSAPHW